MRVMKRVLHAAATFVLIVGAVAVQQTPASADTHDPDVIEEYLHASDCLDDPAFSTANNTIMEIYPCNGGKNQQWRFEDTEDGYLWIVNYYSGKCLTVRNASFALNEPIVQFTCNNGWNEEWYIDAGFVGADGWYYQEIRNHNSELCVTVKNDAHAPGTTMLQWTCNLHENSSWLIDPV